MATQANTLGAPEYRINKVIAASAVGTMIEWYDLHFRQLGGLFGA